MNLEINSIYLSFCRANFSGIHTSGFSFVVYKIQNHNFILSAHYSLLDAISIIMHDHMCILFYLSPTVPYQRVSK